MQEKQILNRIAKAEQRIVDLYRKLTGSNTSTLDYKVFTALLTQSGGSSTVNATSGLLKVGLSYDIDTYNAGDDFSNVGGPAAGLPGEWDGYSFLATGTTPNNWNNSSLLISDEGAPVATVLENTIGNIWFTYGNTSGVYGVNSDGLFTEKTFMEVLNVTDINNNDSGNAFIGVGLLEDDSQLTIQSVASTDGDMYNTPIEIRVYK